MRKAALAVLVAASFMLAATADAAPLNKKRKTGRHWHAGYGYLPGFSAAERRERARERWRAEYRGRFYWYGGPGFYRGRWNGGGFGPCWTRTPIGMMWNCG
jgi:hypothetical protein